MFPYEMYKIMHIFGLCFLFVALGGLVLHAINGGDKASNSAKRLVAFSHGIALLLILVAGFGMLARMGVNMADMPIWVFVKLGIWLLMGAMIAIVYRLPRLARIFWVLLPILGGVAAYVAVYKPFQ